jgi:hypothetical protein
MMTLTRQYRCYLRCRRANLMPSPVSQGHPGALEGRNICSRALETDVRTAPARHEIHHLEDDVLKILTAASS